MATIELEYKGHRYLFNHYISDKNTDEILYVVVSSDGTNYYENIFHDLQSALDYNPSALDKVYYKLTFIFVKAKPDVNDSILVQYAEIRYVNEHLFFERGRTNWYKYRLTVKDFYHDYSYRIESVGFEYYQITKQQKKDLNKPVVFHNGVYQNCVYSLKILRESLGDQNYLPDFKSLSNPIFLEILFMMIVIQKHHDINDAEEITALIANEAKQVNEKMNFSSQVEEKSMVVSSVDTSDAGFSLKELIGLQKVKEEVVELKALASVRKLKYDLGIPVNPSSLHMVFSGNPGTGKTTVARLLGKIYFDLGLLSNDKVFEVSRPDLIGEYIGHTAQKTMKVFENAIGGILFIDEVYTLVKAGNDFGKECIETLIKLMEDNRERIVVIVAGYPQEIELFLNSNPGLRSRFPKTIYFEDYGKKELYSIFEKMVSDNQHCLNDGAKFKLEYLIDKYFEEGYFNSNARTIRNLFELTDQKQALRLSKQVAISDKELRTYTQDDIPDSWS